MLGIDDEKFIRGKVPMTKREIRILTLANANIGAHDFVADIGAGTGSLSIEAAHVATHGQVLAIERNTVAADLIMQNAENFSLSNITVVNAEAPECLKNLPRLDVALVGGTGGRISEILDSLDLILKVEGRIVLNFITVQSLYNCLTWFKEHSNYRYDAIQVQINRLKNLGAYDMETAINPVHIVTATKVSRTMPVSNVINIAEAKIVKIQAAGKVDRHEVVTASPD